MADSHAGHQQADEQAEAGRKRLPVHLDPSQGEKTQFKKGQSGNPAGRKKGQRLLSTEIQRMMDDPKFIERLSAGIKQRTGIDPALDPEFQGTPMKAIITVALIESMNPNIHPDTRNKARTWVGKFGYGTKIDVTSEGERVAVAPLIISTIKPRDLDDDSIPPVEAEAS